MTLPEAIVISATISSLILGIAVTIIKLFKNNIKKNNSENIPERLIRLEEQFKYITKKLDEIEISIKELNQK